MESIDEYQDDYEGEEMSAAEDYCRLIPVGLRSQQKNVLHNEVICRYCLMYGATLLLPDTFTGTAAYGIGIYRRISG